MPARDLTGEVLCLTAALLWAVSVTLYRGPIGRYGARVINLVKLVLAALLQGLTVLLVGQVVSIVSASPRALLFLVASGVIGLVFGDTALFSAVGRIGVHRTLLLQTLAPVFTALIAAAWQGERITAGQAAAAALVLTGVAVVVAPRRLRPDPAGPHASDAAGLAAGVAFGTLAALGQGAGVVLAKAGLAELPALAASFVRLGAAAVAMTLFAAATGRLRRAAGVLRDPWAMRRVAPAMLLGTYVALFAMMGGVALAPASIAAVLMSTSPVFSLFIEARADRKPVTLRGLAGTAIAIAGVVWLTMR